MNEGRIAVACAILDGSKRENSGQMRISFVDGKEIDGKFKIIRLEGKAGEVEISSTHVLISDSYPWALVIEKGSESKFINLSLVATCHVF